MLILLFIPGLLHAQIDPKYAEGTVPVVDGKVVFTKNIPAPGQSKDAIYNALLQWANQRFLPDEEFQSRVLFSDAQAGQIACLGQQYLVFTDKALALDRATVNYQLAINCQDGQAQLKISAIRYLYNIGDNREVIAAEDQITDEYSFNKKKDKLIKATGKFRIATIDLVNETFDEATAALGTTTATAALGTTTATATTATPVAPVQQPAPAPSAQTAAIPASGASALEGYKQITPDKIPGNIYKMLSEDWMLITAGNAGGFNMMTASWGGLGHLYNKPVAFCFINPTRYTINFMESKDTYTLSFYTEAYRDALNYCGTHSGKDGNKVQGSGLTPITTPNGSKAFSEAWLIIDCKKMVEQQFTPEAILDPAAREKWGAEPHKMYICENINVWAK